MPPILDDDDRDLVTEDRYLRLPELARYAGVSIRTLQRFIADPVHPLPVHHLTGRSVHVLRSEFDRWVRERKDHPGVPVHVEDLDDQDRAALALRGYRIARKP